MAMCHACRRTLLAGERYRLWRWGRRDRTVCAVCEPDVQAAGAVPILLAAFAVARHVPDAGRLYDIVFVVVLVSVVVQGSSLSWAARRLGVTPRA